jgi:triosephosphate isomerase
LDDSSRRVILAYEPHWAIGKAEPASVEHIREVTSTLRRWLATRTELANGHVIYGGSAGPGLLTSISDSTDGLFLGRFAHDPAAVEAILDEAQTLPPLVQRTGDSSAQHPGGPGASRPSGTPALRPDNTSARRSDERSGQRSDDPSARWADHKGVTWLLA